MNALFFFFYKKDPLPLFPPNEKVRKEICTLRKFLPRFLSFGGGHFQGKCGAGQNITTPLFLFSFCKVCVVCVTKGAVTGERLLSGDCGKPGVNV